MVVGFTTTCALSAYHHLSCEFESSSWQGVLDSSKSHDHDHGNPWTISEKFLEIKFNSEKNNGL